MSYNQVPRWDGFGHLNHLGVACPELGIDLFIGMLV